MLPFRGRNRRIILMFFLSELRGCSLWSSYIPCFGTTHLFYYSYLGSLSLSSQGKIFSVLDFSLKNVSSSYLTSYFSQSNQQYCSKFTVHVCILFFRSVRESKNHFDKLEPEWNRELISHLTLRNILLHALRFLN